MMTTAKIDIVSFGNLAKPWNEDQGWIVSLKELGLLNKDFKVNYQQNSAQISSDSGLREYLLKPSGDLILVLYNNEESIPEIFDSPTWLEIWAKTPIKRALCSFGNASDSVSFGGDLTAIDRFKKAATVCDLVVSSSEADLTFIPALTPKLLRLPAIDHLNFKAENPFRFRNNMASIADYAPAKVGYEQRKSLLVKLMGPQALARIRNSHASDLNYMVTNLNFNRIYLHVQGVIRSSIEREINEALCCGCAVLAPKPSEEYSRQALKGNRIFYYEPRQIDNCPGLMAHIIDQSPQAAMTANFGRRTILREHTIMRRVLEIAEMLGFGKPSEQQIKKATGAPNERRVVYFKTDAIGDSVLSAGMIEPIKKHYSNSKLAVVCWEQVADFYKSCPLVDEIITFERRVGGFDKEYRLELMEKIHNFHPQIALNPTYSRDELGNFLTAACNADEIVAFEGSSENCPVDIHEGSLQLYTNIIPNKPAWAREIDRNKQFLSTLGIGCEELVPKCWLAKEDEEFADRFFKENNLRPGLVMAVAPGSRSLIKCYPKLSSVLREVKGAQFLLIGDKEDAKLAQEFALESQSNWVIAADRTTITQAAALLKRCKIYIGVDSALAHLAQAVGIPQLVILGGGHFGRFFPYSSLTSVVCLPLECAQCSWKCKYNAAHCVVDIKPEVVIEALIQTLENPSIKPRVFVQRSTLNQDGPKWSLDLSKIVGCEVTYL